MSRGAAAAGSTLFLVVPGVTGGLVPFLLTGWETEAIWLPLRVAGGIALAAGIAAAVTAFLHFVVEGLGTPAPVAPPERLVVGGLYRHVRNPMYVAVTAAIAGRALIAGSVVLLVYGVVVWAACAAFVRLHEEPALGRRYGARYDAYRREVPAWIPRPRPWR